MLATYEMRQYVIILRVMALLIRPRLRISVITDEWARTQFLSAMKIH